jgi:chromosome partitioning protein
MITVTVCQRKGGNGKSTSSLNLAHAFALSGLRVLLIDLDEQKNTTSAIATQEVHPRTIEDLLVDDAIAVSDVIAPTGWEGVSLIASSVSLSGAIRELDGEVGSHLVLKEKLVAARDLFDICLIDTSPSLNILVVNALCASRYVFIPLSSRYFSLQGLGQTLESVRKVSTRLNGELSVLALAFVIHDGRSSLAKEVVEKARSEYPELVCGVTVSQNIRIEEAQVMKQSIFSYAPADRGAAQYRALADELLSRMGR